MDDEHAKLHQECGRFDSELRAYCSDLGIQTGRDRAAQIPKVAYVRMKAAELVQHFDQFRDAIAGANHALAYDAILDVLSDIQFLCEEGESAKACLVEIINRLEGLKDTSAKPSG